MKYIINNYGERIMDNITKGTWIINSVKHLVDAKTNTLELNSLEATEQAGKAGILLARLASDNQEIVSRDKLSIFARQSGLTSGEIPTYANYLKGQGKVDFSKDNLGRIKELEVYCFSMEDAIETTTNIFESLQPKETEEASIIGLQSTFELPRTKDEFINEITCKGIEENTANEVMQLQQTLSLVKTNVADDKPILFNEYAFSGDSVKIKKALTSLSTQDSDMVKHILETVTNSQGYLYDTFLENKEIDRNILTMMEGIGLLDGIEVKSQYGNATFLTTPQLRGQGVGQFKISADVFHKAKLLLSCLRYGQIKSISSRGRISTKSKMLNIINKLISGAWMGPCTAIGQDYKLLEIDGVIQTRSRERGMYDMKLRQTDVGRLVKEMITFNKLVTEDTGIGDIFDNQPTSYIIPEQRKKTIEAKTTKPIEEYREKLLVSLRTGGDL